MGDNVWEWWSDGGQCMGVKESLYNGMTMEIIHIIYIAQSTSFD